MSTYISPDEIMLNILFAVILIVGFGIILAVFTKMVKRWDVRIALDDGMTIRYVKARVKGRTEKNNKVYYVVEYRDPDDKRVVEVLIPDEPGYLRLMRFWFGLHKYIVYRVDKSGQAIPWEHKGALTIPSEKLEYFKTHEMIINALRTRIVLSKYMLYMVLIIAIVLLFTGIIVWRALERPIIVQVIENATRTSTPPLPQPPRV